MRKIVLSAAVLGGLGLAGCAGTAGTSPVTSAEAQAFLAEVQQYASAACAFEPTAVTVAEIAAASSNSATAGVALAKQIAGQVCAAVTARSARRGAARAPHVGRVVVHGTFDDGTRI